MLVAKQWKVYHKHFLILTDAFNQVAVWKVYGFNFTGGFKSIPVFKKIHLFMYVFPALLQKGFKRLTAIQKTQHKSKAEKREGRKTRGGI